MICPNCNTENRANAKYCDECGYELPTVAPVADEIFGKGEDDDGSLKGPSDTVLFDGLDHMMDSSYDPVEDLDHLADREDITRSFAAPSYADQRRVYTAFDTSNESSRRRPSMRGCGTSCRNEKADPSKDRANARFAAKGPISTCRDGMSSARGKGVLEKLRDPDRRKKAIKGMRAALMALLCAAIIAGIVAATTYSMQIWGGKIVPEVVGMQSSEAKSELEGIGFSVEIVQVKSDEVENIVLSTEPEYGSRIEEGSTVKLNVSMARVIPNVIGLAEDEAEKLLAQEGFTNIGYTQVTSNEPEGTILSSAPVEGTRAKGDAKITLEVAVPFRVPQVHGMSAEEARSALEAQGYAVETKEVYAEDVEEGHAAGTDPPANTALPSGSTVTLNLAKHRSTELVALTRAFLKEHDRVKINGVNYEISEITKVSFTSGNECSYTIVARKYETNTWAIFGQTETRYGNYETIDGTIRWNDSNEIESMDPEIKEA